MRLKAEAATNRQNSEGAIPSDNTVFRKHKPCGYVFHQSFGKGQNNPACITCSEKEQCLAEA
jgi:hypothetical protein